MTTTSSTTVDTRRELEALLKSRVPMIVSSSLFPIAMNAGRSSNSQFSLP